MNGMQTSETRERKKTFSQYTAHIIFKMSNMFTDMINVELINILRSNRHIVAIYKQYHIIMI